MILTDLLCASGAPFAAAPSMKAKETVENADASIFSTKQYGAPKDVRTNPSVIPSGNTMYSASGPLGWLIGPLVDVCDGNTKDGRITPTNQVGTGDCWLLSGVNALSYSEEGRKIIKDSLEYHKNYTIVHFDGIGMDYKVKNWEVTESKGSLQYSSGDDDMIIFELAMEKALDDIARGQVVADEKYGPNFLHGYTDTESTKMLSSSTEGGFSSEMIYYLTGQIPKRTTDKDEMDEFLTKYQQNGGKTAVMAASTGSKTRTVKDAKGKNAIIFDNHAYAVKKVTDDTVTITNPWASGDNIVLPRETFIDVFEDVEYADLADEKPTTKYVTDEYTYDNEGNRVFTFDYSDNPKNSSYQTECYKQEVYFSFIGGHSKTVTKGKDDNILSECNYKSGVLKDRKVYDGNGTLRDEYTYGPFGNNQKYIKYNEDGHLSHEINYSIDGYRTDATYYADDGSILLKRYYGKKESSSREERYQDGELYSVTFKDGDGKVQKEITTKEELEQYRSLARFLN